MKQPDSEKARIRTVTWQDPLISAREVGAASGLELMQRMIAGEIPHPPICELIGFRLVEVEHGLAVFEFEPAEFHYNPIGMVHGAMAGVLLDSAMGCSVHATLPAGVGYTTLEFKVNLVRAVTMKTGLLRAEGRTVHGGAKTATAEGRLVGVDGKLYAHASTTCLVLPLRQAGT